MVKKVDMVFLSRVSSWKSYFDNKVGIGVTAPTVALDVSGEIKASGNITAFF